jgi:hypothetical protein
VNEKRFRHDVCITWVKNPSFEGTVIMDHKTKPYELGELVVWLSVDGPKNDVLGCIVDLAHRQIDEEIQSDDWIFVLWADGFTTSDKSTIQPRTSFFGPLTLIHTTSSPSSYGFVVL